MNPLLAQFMIEARDLLDDAVQGLLRMERGEGGAEVVNTVFRAVHTLKGTSGLFEMAPLTMMVHGGEDLLDAVRAGRLGLTGAMVDQLLLLMDQTRSWIEVLETNGELPAGADVISATRAAALRAMLVGAVARVDAPAAAAAAAVMAGPRPGGTGGPRRRPRPGGDRLSPRHGLLLQRRRSAATGSPGARTGGGGNAPAAVLAADRGVRPL